MIVTGLDLSLGAVGDITASTDDDVDKIIGDVETGQLNVDKVGERFVVTLDVSDFDYRYLV